jgi:O-antigen/teichoic acid export membrane protein
MFRISNWLDYRRFLLGASNRGATTHASLANRFMISRGFIQTSAIVGLGNGLTALIGIAALRIYTELAPANVFGAANLVLGALGLGLQILVQPINATQLRYHTAQQGQADRFTAQSLRWALAASGVFAALAGIGFAVWTTSGDERASAAMLAAAAGWIFVLPPRQIFMTRLHAEQRMTVYMALRVAEAALTALATGLILTAAVSADSLVWGQVVGSFGLLAAISTIAPWPVWRLLATRSTMPGFLKMIWRFGAPFMPMAVLFWLGSLADRYMLGALVSAAAAGQYLAASAIASSGFGLTNGAMSDLFRPKLFDAENAGNRERAHRIFSAWVGVYLAISLCGLATIVLLGHWIVELVLAEAYRHGAVEIMLWIALGSALNGLTTAFENRIFSLGISARVLLPLAAGAVSNIFFSYLLIQWNGIVGAAQASCLSFCLKLLLTAFLLRHALEKRK